MQDNFQLSCVGRWTQGLRVQAKLFHSRARSHYISSRSGA